MPSSPPPDVARLPIKPEHKLRAWALEYLDGREDRLANHALLSTDASFAKFRAPDGSLVMVSTNALRCIKTIPSP